MKSQSRTKGVLISYATTIIRTLSRLILTPLYLKVLGVEEYGFYQYVFSIASYATILDFGISSVVNKFSIEKKEKGDSKGVENVMFYALVFSGVAALAIVVMGIIISAGAPVIFGDSIAGRVDLTRQLLAFIIGELILLMFQHYFEGVILSAECYVTLRSVALVQILLRMLVTVLLLYSNFGVMSIALGDFIGVALCLGYEVYYSFRKLKLKVRFHYYDPELLRSIAKLSVALCMQSVVTYLNSSIDKYVLGRSLNTAAVTIYSVALTFSSFFDEIPTAIQRLYLPQVVKIVASGADGEELTSFVIKPGRYQCMLVCGVLGAFILFGRQFICFWSGEETLDAWLVALFLMIPSVLPLVQNVCLSILTAMNKRMFRSYVLCGIAIVNLFTTILLVQKYGLIGAAVATCLSLVVGNNLAMNLYYKYVIHINVGRLFRSIFKGILPCAVAACCICAPMLMVKNGSVVWFLMECVIFCLIYGGMLLVWGMNAEEKHQVKAACKRFVHRK